MAVEKLSLSPKKRGADSSEAETASPKKKRAPAKKKAEITGGVEKAPKNKRAPKGKAAGASVEAEANENEDLAKAPKSKGKKQTVNVKEPKTPKPKRGIKPEAEDDGEHEANGNKKTTHVIKQESPLTSPEATVPVTPKRKAKPGSGEEDAAKANEQNANSKAITHTPKKPRVGGNKIPGGTDVPASFELASTADKKMFSMKDAGSSWAEIRAMWKKETGQDTANSTLPNR